VSPAADGSPDEVAAKAEALRGTTRPSPSETTTGRATTTSTPAAAEESPVGAAYATTGVSSTSRPTSPQKTGAPASESEANAIIQQALREQETERSDNLSDLRAKLLARTNMRRNASIERNRVLDALKRIAALQPGEHLRPPFLPSAVEGTLAKKAAETGPKTFIIDGQTLILPPEIYKMTGFDKAIAALPKVRALSPTTGGPQGCGAGCKNELVNNAFQFLATNAVLTKNGTGNANMDYSVFVKELEKYGISSTADQADKVAGGTVTLEGGRKVEDGVSDGNLDMKDIEWTKSSEALAGAIGIKVGDLLTNSAEFDKEYGSIATLLTDKKFNPADNDVLVEVLLIASMLEKSGKAIDGALTTEAELTAYLKEINSVADAPSLTDDDVRKALLARDPKDRNVEFADLSEPAPGTNAATSPRDRISRDVRGDNTVSVRGKLDELHGGAKSRIAVDSASSGLESNSFVAKQASLLATALRDEHRLKLKLLDMDLGPQTPASMVRNQTEAWNTLGELRSINMDRKLPVLRDLATYIVKNRDALDGMRADAAAVNKAPARER